MLEVTFDRIAPLAPRARTLVIVGRSHLDVASEQIAGLAPARVLVQPANRDTGPGLVFSLEALAGCDGDPTLAVFPSDHYVRDDAAFRSQVLRAARIVGRFPDKIALLGIEPDRPEPGFGYVEPGCPLAARQAGAAEVAFHVRAFREKPAPEVAERLLDRGGLWNSFVMVFKLRRMLELLGSLRPADVERVRRQAGCFPVCPEVYGSLPRWNFCADFLARIPAHLVVLRCAGTGWSDWGPPQAIERTLAPLQQVPPWHGAAAVA